MFFRKNYHNIRPIKTKKPYFCNKNNSMCYEKNYQYFSDIICYVFYS